jgi:chromosome segregation ATPase
MVACWAAGGSKMGLPAHDASGSVPKTPEAMSDHETLLGRIRAELANSRRDLSQVEQTLTDGYARALSLEAERLRLLRRLGSLAATLEGDDLAGKTKELSSLAKQIEAHNGVLNQLRELLDELRKEYSRGASAARARHAG